MAQPQNPGYTTGRSPTQRAQAAAAADLAAPRREFLVAPPAWAAAGLLPLLRDARDAPVLWLLLNICCSSVPCAAALYVCGVQSQQCARRTWRLRLASTCSGSCWLCTLLNTARCSAGQVSWINRRLLVWPMRSLRAGEDIQHAAFGTPRLNAAVPTIAELNWCVSLLLAPLFGLPSGLYNLHHVLMHHVEGNELTWDLSSTEPYQRDNVFQFIRCAARPFLSWAIHALKACYYRMTNSHGIASSTA